MPVCRQASIRAGIPTIPPAKENDFRQGCVSLLLRGSIWRCRGSLWRSLATLSTAFPGVWPIETASALCLSTKPLPVCLCAGRHTGIQERGFLKGCILLPLRGSIWRCRGSLWRSLPGLIATHLAFGLWPLFGIFTIPMPVCQRAGRQAQGQADWQAGELAGGQECLPPGKEEC